MSNLSITGGLCAPAERAAALHQYEYLETNFENIKDQNGLITGLWDSVKSASGLGVDSKECNDAVEAFKRGEIDFEQADKKLKEYARKQESSLNLFSNIAASIAALGVTAAAAASIAATGGTAAPLVLAAIAGGTGALTKAGFKLADRASNNVSGDALDLKQTAKDALSGAVTGSIAVVTMGTASSYDTIGKAIFSCAKTGVETGAVSCGANYAIDTALDEKRDFDAGEFLMTAGEGALFGGAVGAFMGGLNSSMHHIGVLKSGCGFSKFIKENGGSRNDFLANSGCTAAYKISNDRLRHAV